MSSVDFLDKTNIQKKKSHGNKVSGIFHFFSPQDQLDDRHLKCVQKPVNNWTKSLKQIHILAEGKAFSFVWPAYSSIKLINIVHPNVLLQKKASKGYSSGNCID